MMYKVSGFAPFCDVVMAREQPLSAVCNGCSCAPARAPRGAAVTEVARAAGLATRPGFDIPAAASSR